MRGRPSVRDPIALLAAVAALVASPAAAQETEPHALTLDEAVAIALERSPAAARAEAERLQASAERWEGFGRLLPSVSMGTGVSQYAVLQRTATDPITGGIVQLPDENVERRRRFGTDAMVSAQWTVFDGGRTYARMRADRFRAEAATEAADAVRARTVGEVTLAYLDALEAGVIREVREAEVVSTRELERTARARFEVGEVAEIDLLQARLAASDAELALLQAEAAARDAGRALRAVIGLPAGADVTLVEPERPLVPADPDALRDLLLRESPVLRELHARHDAAVRQQRADRTGWLPSLSIGAAWVRSEVGATHHALTTDLRNTETFYSATLSWTPLNQPASIVARRQAGLAARRRAEADLVTGQRTLLREVDGALDRLTRAEVLRSRAELNLDLADRQRDQAQERYRLGVAPLVERLTADALWAEARYQEIVARHAVLRAVAELEAATGVMLRVLIDNDPNRLP